MPNRYQGLCYICDHVCNAGEGVNERYKTRWRIAHKECIAKQDSQKSLELAIEAYTNISKMLNEYITATRRE